MAARVGDSTNPRDFPQLFQYSNHSYNCIILQRSPGLQEAHQQHHQHEGGCGYASANQVHAHSPQELQGIVFQKTGTPQ